MFRHFWLLLPAWLSQNLELVCLGCGFRFAVFPPGWCLWRAEAWCNWRGCYFRLVVLVFAWLGLDWTWYYCFPKNIFGLKTEGQQFAKRLTWSQLCGLSCATGPAALPSQSIDLQQYETTNSDCQTKLPSHPISLSNLSLCPDPPSFSLYVCLTLGCVFHFFGSIFFHLPVSFHNSFLIMF